jgi:hypothetical protein
VPHWENHFTATFLIVAGFLIAVRTAHYRHDEVMGAQAKDALIAVLLGVMSRAGGTADSLETIQPQRQQPLD